MSGIGFQLGLRGEKTYCEVIKGDVSVFMLDAAGGRHGQTGEIYLACCSGRKQCRAPGDEVIRRWAAEFVGCPLCHVPSLKFGND